MAQTTQERQASEVVQTGTSGKLVGKDFITAGIFSVLAFVSMLVAAVANITPTTYFAYAALSILLIAPIYLVFMGKVAKRWSIPLFFFVPCTYMCLGGVEGIMAGATILAFAVMADLVIGRNRTSFKKLTIAYLVIAAAFEIGAQVRLFMFTDDYLQQAVRIGLDQSYIDYLAANATYATWGICIIITVVAAVMGLLIGKRLARRQLKAAGIK